MFQVELLSGGVFIVYAVDTNASMFLIYRDGYWAWIDVTECKPYTPPWMGVLNCRPDDFCIHGVQKEATSTDE